MDYLDFELRVGVGDGIEYPVTVIRAAAGGQPSISTSLPVDDAALRIQMDQLIHARHADAAARGIEVRDRPMSTGGTASGNDG